jgi:hypothetical protein
LYPLGSETSSVSFSSASAGAHRERHGDRETGEAFHPAKLFMGRSTGLFGIFRSERASKKFNAL